MIIVSRKTYVVNRDDVVTKNLRGVDWRGECVTLADEVAEVGVKVHEFEKARDDCDIAKCAGASCIVVTELRGGGGAATKPRAPHAARTAGVHQQ